MMSLGQCALCTIDLLSQVHVLVVICKSTAIHSEIVVSILQHNKMTCMNLRLLFDEECVEVIHPYRFAVIRTPLCVPAQKCLL